MPMDAITTVKAEIKAWERDFRAQNGRNPTVEDIKEMPNIAEKYKSYKRLVKEGGLKAAADQGTAETPKTPRKSSKTFDAVGTAAAILPKSRPVTSPPDISTKNPFSPAKRKRDEAWISAPNPFLIPLKTTKRSASSDPPSPPSPSTSSVPPPPVPGAGMSKARKRLHGEPVSPSPKPRGKRRRVDVLNPPPPQESALASSSRNSTPPTEEEGDSFVDESPVKPPTGKAFTPIFEEAVLNVAVPNSQPDGRKSDLGNRSKNFRRAKTVPGGLFGSVKGNKSAQSISGSDIFGNSNSNIGGTSGVGKPNGKDSDQSIEKSNRKRLLPGPVGLIPSRNDLHVSKAPIPGPSSAPSRNSGTLRKRSLSEAMQNEERTTSNVWGLLPPSPPPMLDDPRPKGIGKGKPKMGVTGKRKDKKARLSCVESDEEMVEPSSEEVDVTTVAWRGRTQTPQRADVDDATSLELDPELRLQLRAAGPSPASASPQLERFEVDLPEEMRRMLALSPHDRLREREEEDVVRGLMKGLRMDRGEIWVPGEVDQRGDDGGPVVDDDWEGEGIPWEVAEL